MSVDAGEFQRDLLDLIGGLDGRRTLLVRDPAAPIPAAVGTATPARASVAPGGDGGGIASPLTEVARIWGTGFSVSSDGLFAWPHVARVDYVDANGATVTVLHP